MRKEEKMKDQEIPLPQNKASDDVFMNYFSLLLS